jgi:hypothetical protein
MKTDTLILNRSLGAAIPEDYIDWAVNQLQSGIDTPNLRILAGLSVKFDNEEIESYFTKVCKELDIDAPLKTDNYYGTARLIKRAYDNKEISAKDAIKRMFDLYVESEYDDPLLSIWYSIDEELSHKGSEWGGYFYPVELLDSLDDLFVNEFNLFERALKLKLPRGFINFIKCEQCGYIGNSHLKPRYFKDKLVAKLPWGRKPALWHTCSECGSFEYISMSDPAVRNSYLSKLEREQGACV